MGAHAMATTQQNGQRFVLAPFEKPRDYRLDKTDNTLCL